MPENGGEVNAENAAQPEPQAGKDSCFPVEPEISRRIMDRISATDVAGKRAFVEEVCEEEVFKNSALAAQMTLDLQEIQEGADKDKFEEAALEYKLGITIAYSILKEQAKVRDIRFPIVTQEVIDAYKRDIEEQYPDDSPDILRVERDKIAKEDSGFMNPIKEYAPDPEIYLPQFIFLTGAIDTYNQIKRAETADKMIREIGLEEE